MCCSEFLANILELFLVLSHYFILRSKMNIFTFFSTKFHVTTVSYADFNKTSEAQRLKGSAYPDLSNPDTKIIKLRQKYWCNDGLRPEKCAHNILKIKMCSSEDFSSNKMKQSSDPCLDILRIKGQNIKFDPLYTEHYIVLGPYEETGSPKFSWMGPVIVPRRQTKVQESFFKSAPSFNLFTAAFNLLYEFSHCLFSCRT